MGRYPRIIFGFSDRYFEDAFMVSENSGVISYQAADILFNTIDIYLLTNPITAIIMAVMGFVLIHPQ